MNFTDADSYASRINNDQNFAKAEHVETAIKAIIYFNPDRQDFHTPKYENDILSLRPYSDADYDNYDECEDIPPHFYHKESGFWVSWHKHPGRGLSWEPITVADLRNIVVNCLSSY